MLIENVEQLQSLSSLRVLRLASKGMGFRVWSERRLRLMPDILPPSIVELRVDSCFTIVPAVLSGAPKLTYLELSSCHFETQGGTGLKFDGAALLEVFSGLSELDTLILEYFSDVDWPTPSSVYGGLTASSRLRELHIRGMHKWPQSASKYVFPPGRVLPHVRCIDWCDAEWAWDAEGVARVVSACAGLQELQLHVVSNPHVANALQPLTTLTHLSLSGLGVRDCYFTNQVSEAANNLSACWHVCTGVDRMGIE